MATITTSLPADFASRSQIYFNRQLMKGLTYNLRLGAFGLAKELPANSSTMSIRFFRAQSAKKGTATNGPRAMSEGVTLATSNGAAIGYVDVTLKQRGDVKTLTDVILAIDLFDTKANNSRLMGAEAALDYDFVCSHAIVSDTTKAMADGTPNPITSGQRTMFNSNTSYERFAGLANTGVSADDFTTFAAMTNSQAKITRSVILGAVTRLKGVNGKPGVPMINGKYKALLPTEVMMNLREDSVWMESAVFNNNKAAGSLDQWNEFSLDGCDFIEQQSPFIETAGNYGVYSPDANENTANNIYSCLILGDEAFGVPKLSGTKAGSSPVAPSMIIVDKPDHSDPAAQLITLAWKAFYGASLLWTSEATDKPHCVVLRAKSTYR